MNTTKYIWKNGEFIAWGDATTHVLTHSLHYGSAVFEGIRFYSTEKGSAIFKLHEHIDRFFYSAQQLGMKINYSKTQTAQAIVHTVFKNNCLEGYIRPLAYYGYGNMRVVPTSDLPVDVIIACWPWKNYLSAEIVDVAISPYIRIHPQSTIADAKISGHYVNSILSGLAIQHTPYHEALLLDTKGNVTEGGAENIFIVKNEKIITTPPGTILVGITRNTVLQIAQDLNIPIEERYFTPEEIYTAEEAFLSGTAIEITPIRSLNNQLIGRGRIGPVTEKIKQKYYQIVRGECAEYSASLTYVQGERVVA